MSLYEAKTFMSSPLFLYLLYNTINQILNFLNIFSIFSLTLIQGVKLMNIEIFQLKIEPANVSFNETTIKNWFSNYVTTETDVVVLPEMWNNGYALPQLNKL